MTSSSVRGGALLETIVQAAAGSFEAAAASVALLDDHDPSLRYVASWGAGARETVGLKLPVGVGIAGSVIKNDRAEVVERCPHRPTLRRRPCQPHRVTCRTRCWLYRCATKAR